MTTKIPVGTPYFQDHGFGRWPEEWADVEFSITRSGDSLKLVAPGFGELSGDYGNGAIWVQEADWLRAHPMTTAQKPDALPVVAWIDDGLSANNGTKDSVHRVVTDKTKRDMPHAAVTAYNDALVRLSDAQASLLAKEAECEALREDAERWQYVRHHWSNAQMFWNNDATNSLKSIVLTIKTAHWTSGASDIERQIDAARAAADKGGAS